jgi:menaquinol-cytochrome c reductase cytochrome b/c subunit
MSAPPPFELVESKDPLQVPRRVALVRHDVRPAVHDEEEPHVMTFPHLIVREVILFQMVVTFLSIAAILFDAPLEGIANPVETPNPAKAPWYFLGLQELLHYFPPIVAGVLLPTLVVLALVVIPYARINLTAGPLWQGGGRARLLGVAGAVAATAALFGAYECWPIVVPTVLIGSAMLLARRGGTFARITLPEWIMTWFVIIATVLTLIGTFFRGPGWSFVWPWSAVLPG